MGRRRIGDWDSGGGGVHGTNDLYKGLVKDTNVFVF